MHLKNIFSLCIFFLLISTNSIAQKETLTIPAGKVGMIGYGSLTSKTSMESTLGKAYTDTIRVVHIQEYERVWNYAMPNNGQYRPILFYEDNKDTIYPNKIIFLNIQPNIHKSINACLFIIDSTDLVSFDIREVGYKRIDVTHCIQEIDIKNGNVYAYIALPEFTTTTDSNIANNAIALKYINVVEASFNYFGENFKIDYQNSTIPYPPSIAKELKTKFSE